MAKTTRIDRKLADTLSLELTKAAQEIAAKYGLKASRRAGSFSETIHNAKVEFSVTETAEGKTPEQDQFERYAQLYNLEASDFGKEITLQGERFTIAGLKAKASKNTIIIKRVSDGKQFVTSDNTVRNLLGRTTKAKTGNKCKYCGKDNHSADPDVLCGACRETFGHALHSEL